MAGNAPKIKPEGHNRNLAPPLQEFHNSPPVQTKLEIGEPGDKYEQEADKMADKVMMAPYDRSKMVMMAPNPDNPTLRMMPIPNKNVVMMAGSPDNPTLKLKPQTQRNEQMDYDDEEQVQLETQEGTEKVQLMGAGDEEEDEVIRQKHDVQKSVKGASYASPDLANKIGDTNGSGQPLAENAQKELGGKMGADFSQVKIHSNKQSIQMSEELGAKAFTHGNDIYFNKGEYNPNSQRGKHLLAHELTHTLQQSDSRKSIQRSLKFEIQTVNYIWQKDELGKFTHVKRKFGEFGSTERGDLPAYITTGQHGVAARKKGELEYVEVKGERTMKKAKGKSVDESKPAQFIKEYTLNKEVTAVDLIGKPVTVGELELVKQANNAEVLADESMYNLNTFEFIYRNSAGLKLDIHLDQNRIFQAGHWPHMKVGRKKPTGLDKKKEAQYVETWKVTEDPAGVTSYYDPVKKLELMVTIEEVTALKKDHSNRGEFPSIQYNPGTYEKKYYKSADFSEDALTGTPSQLNVHLDDGRLEAGHTKFMEQRVSPGKEQTAMELQSESHGFIEFETPKWFRNWEDLKLRVQDAVDMAMMLNTGSVVTLSDDEKAEMQGIKDADSRTPPKGQTLGTIREWPAGLISLGVSKRLGSKKLYVEIVDTAWRAFFQTSEGISISQFGSALEEYTVFSDPYYTAISSKSKEHADKVFTAAKAASSLAAKDDSLFSNLRGFLQLVVAYIIWGQYKYRSGGKNTFAIMARNDYSEMYEALLSPDEKSLYQSIIGNTRDKDDNPLLSTELETIINDIRGSRISFDGRDHDIAKAPIKLTRSTPFYIDSRASANPSIYSWLSDMTNGRDRLSGDQAHVSDAIGGKGLSNTPDDKDYKHAMLEKRIGIGKPPASGWVAYAKARFEEAMGRSADTPDNPVTPDTDESSKTSLKWN